MNRNSRLLAAAAALALVLPAAAACEHKPTESGDAPGGGQRDERPEQDHH